VTSALISLGFPGCVTCVIAITGTGVTRLRFARLRRWCNAAALSARFALAGRKGVTTLVS
jgi:hypothetical protein